MVSHDLKEASVDQKTHGRLIPEPDHRKNLVVFNTFQLKDQQ